MTRDTLVEVAVEEEGSEEEKLVSNTDRRAMLLTQRAERKALYDKEIQQLQDDIAHQRDVLLAIQAEKKQQQQLHTLRKELESLRTSAELATNADARAQRNETAAKTWKLAPSPAQDDWDTWENKKVHGNAPINELMSMVGLEAVKVKFLEILRMIETTNRQKDLLQSGDGGENSNANPLPKSFHAAFIGNPGTGKTTVARLYNRFLKSQGILLDHDFHKTSGASLLTGGVKAFKEAINKVNHLRPQGVLLIDRPQSLATDKGREVVEYMLHEMTRLEGKVTFVFSGSMRDLEEFLRFDARLRRLVHFDFKFEDLKDPEILQLLKKKIKDMYNGKMRLEMGDGELYLRIASRRIGRGRGKSEFGNGHDVEEAVKQIQFRQTNRLAERRRNHQEADDFFLTKTDMIGLPPSEALSKSEAWTQLNKMIGLDSVKQAVRVFVDRAQTNYQRDLDEQPPVQISLNKVFLGSPGTGKTTVAGYYGRILADIGLLSRGEVIAKNPSDFIGQAIGESEQKTKAILEAARGNVLIIDEAYGLSGASSGGSSSDAHSGQAADSYKSAVIDTLVAEVQSTAGEDRCVLLLGYKESMEQLFQSVNPALGRRFPMSSAFEFHDYTDEELQLIFKLKLKEAGFRATERAEEVAMQILHRSRNHRNFGNAGEVDIVLDRAKNNQQARLSKAAASQCGQDLYLLVPQDIDPDFDRLERADVSIRKLFEDFIGMEELVQKLEGYQRIVQSSKELKFDAESLIPFNFLFRGPPGTGKTTVAERMGQVFYEMGILATKDVERCSTTDIIGEYVGQTGPKVQRVFEKALGKVLFIDEAYRLADTSYGRDALAEMTNILTLPKYKDKMVTILAGYDDEIDRLMMTNPGLTSRFPENISFVSLSPENCWELLFKRAKAVQGSLDVSLVNDKEAAKRLCPIFAKLSSLPRWGNGRDIETLSGTIVGNLMRSRPPSLIITEEIVSSEMNALLHDRQQRATTKTTAAGSHTPSSSISTSSPPYPPGNGGRDDEIPERVQGLDQTESVGPSVNAWSQVLNVNAASRVDELSDSDDDENEEDKMREFLGHLGLCPQNFIWIRESSGWRCEGGSHYLSDDEVRRQMADA
ncbi:P-loop containing nucleoside triphosphate hydrolase protein [Microdochium bolleyi]|uniref:p-loop containing nucleoside triphosphate hydrolase protein n=1 Tax=Microdochium bolleyi TaxID=196109 RepID=A0A136IWW0_9PEZI|nr:P-loop containing nucleoside triphosphate hydrolase protein [Microdochium bolleyi]